MGVLVATDVAARGLDIANVEHVIHYDVPQNAEVGVTVTLTLRMLSYSRVTRSIHDSLLE